eukprot:6501635-Alexandrium_andersonii.AAC.1
MAPPLPARASLSHSVNAIAGHALSNALARERQVSRGGEGAQGEAGGREHTRSTRDGGEWRSGIPGNLNESTW